MERAKKKKKEQEEEQKVNKFEDLMVFFFLLSWLSELWILAAGSENVKNFAPVIPGVGHHNEKKNKTQ